MTMETKRDVEEALTLFDQLTEEEQHIALECLWDISYVVCKEEKKAV